MPIINDSITHSSENPSICVPRVFTNVSMSYISNIFHRDLKLGKIRKIDIVSNNGDKKFKKVFIHFDHWYDGDQNNAIKNKLLDGKLIKLVHDYPWYWKCALNKTG